MKRVLAAPVLVEVLAPIEMEGGEVVQKGLRAKKAHGNMADERVLDSRTQCCHQAPCVNNA